MYDVDTCYICKVMFRRTDEMFGRVIDEDELLNISWKDRMYYSIHGVAFLGPMLGFEGFRVEAPGFRMQGIVVSV